MINALVLPHLLAGLRLAEGGELSDADVEVSEVAWVPLAEVSRCLAYVDERRLVDGVPALLADSA